MKVLFTEIFKKNFKKLQKKDKKIIDEFEKLLSNINTLDELSIDLGANRYKIRMKNSSNNKGKSAGYRVIFYKKIDKEVIFIYIYSKSELDNISSHKIDEILSNYKPNTN